MPADRTAFAAGRKDVLSLASILIIDDDAGVRRLLRMALERGGHAVTEAGNGAEGVQLYRTAGAMVIPLHDAAFSSGQTVLLENLAMDTPTIVTDVPGIRDYLVPGVVRVPVHDPEALGRASTGQSSHAAERSPGRSQPLSKRSATQASIVDKRGGKRRPDCTGQCPASGSRSGWLHASIRERGGPHLRPLRRAQLQRSIDRHRFGDA